MAEGSTQTSIQDIPDWMKNYMSTADSNYTGILDEAMRQYRARSGQLTDQQLADLQMPNRQVAGRTPLQTQATQLAQSGVGSVALATSQTFESEHKKGVSNLCA